MWKNTIVKHLRHSIGYINCISAANTVEPWKSDTFSEDQFIFTCQTGDILLFRGNMSGPMIIRTVTNSEFDHVAMIIRLQNDPEVYFVEATGNRGVTYNKWSNVRAHIGPDKFYAKLSWRKVENKRETTTNLSKFLEEAIGSTYEIGAKKLLRQKSITEKNFPDGRKYVETGRTFFCSELVAKAFKIMGIIEDDETSCT